MSRGRYKKAVELLGKRIGEHRFKQRMAGSPELFHYYEKEIGKFGYHLKIRLFPHHILRENPLASGAGADRMSKGMQLAYGKLIGCAARVREGQILFELKVNKEHLNIAREALIKASKKFPCSCKIVMK